MYADLVHFDGGDAVGVQQKVGAGFINRCAFNLQQAALRVIKAFGQRQYQRQLIDGVPVFLGQHTGEKLVAEEVAFGYAVVPASNGAGDKLFFMRQPEQFGVLYHVSAVACVAVKVNGNADVVQQRRCF